MITQRWATSQREYDVLEEKDVSILMSDGVSIDCNVFRPEAKIRFPGILGIQRYDKTNQTASIIPSCMTWKNGG